MAGIDGHAWNGEARYCRVAWLAASGRGVVLEMPFCSSPRQRGSTGSTPRSVDGRCRQAGVFWWRAVMVGWLTGRVWWTGWTGVAADRGSRPRSGSGVVRARPTPRPIGYTLVWPLSGRPFSLVDRSMKGRQSGHLSGHPPGHTPGLPPGRRRGRRTLAGLPEPSFPLGSAETNLALHRHMHGEGEHKIHAEIERCVCETGGGLLRHIDGTNAGTEPSVQPHRSANLLLAQKCLFSLFAWLAKGMEPRQERN